MSRPGQQPKTFGDLQKKILKILPNAQFDDDNNGQLVIYTGKRCDGGGDSPLIDFDEDEEDEQAPQEEDEEDYSCNCDACAGEEDNNYHEEIEEDE